MMSLFDFIPTIIHNGQQLKKTTHNKFYKSLFPAVVNDAKDDNSGRFFLYRGRTSFKLFNSCKEGAVSLEASLAFPIILTLFITLFWLLQIFWVHTEIEASLYTTGHEIVATSYAFSSLFSKDNLDADVMEELKRVVFNETFVGNKIRKSLAGKRTKYLNILLSDVKKTNDIDIKVTYLVKPIISIPGIEGVWLTNHFYSKAYVGDYSLRSKEREDVIVYITKTASVYHTSLSCSSLKSTVEQVTKDNIWSARNKDGSKYYPCSKCEHSDSQMVVFITPYGTRYHSTVNCSELKADIYAVKLSEVEGKRKCRLCP